MSKCLNLIKSIVPELNTGQLKESFAHLGIDLVTIRVEFERALEFTISDKDWLSFQSFYDVIEYCDKNQKPPTIEENKPLKPEEVLQINMPQMAIHSLSENWLFKKIGSKHWTLLCDGLGTKSNEIQDELENRLYATFVRIRIEINSSLSQFIENEELALNSSINRYGNGLYFSNVKLYTNRDNRITAKLMTSFARRSGHGNKGLAKSQPFVSNNLIEGLKEMPEFGNEYRLLKRKKQEKLILNNFEFRIKEEILFEKEYKLNPYYDLNGVGLLYFASYPIINDFCEAFFANEKYAKNVKNRWEENYFTQARDILYYSNCDIHEVIVYRLHSIEFIEDKVLTYSSLNRKSDNKKMADLFTIKTKTL